ncbi:MAG TPA: HhH-GPD-type base excision DNA repair protein [Acidimicrobiales bacterium]|nr:HhH-GPD-type base excision DNA repair protein [Acidimicrobiales bacterium]
MAARKLHLSGDRGADALLSKDPLALLIGMVLDQQIPLERAFAAPAELARRLGGAYDATSLAAMDPDELGAVFAARPALHRFPGSMAARVQALCVVVVDQYGGDASRVWRDAPDGKALLVAVKALPGFGEQKARIFVALLGKQLGVRPKGWEQASSPFGDPGSFRSIADIVDPESLAGVRAFKQQMKAAAKVGTPASKK